MESKMIQLTLCTTDRDTATVFRWHRIREETGSEKTKRGGASGQQVGNFRAQLNSNKLRDASRRMRTDEWTVGVSFQLSVRFVRCQFLDKNKVKSPGGKKRQRDIRNVGSRGVIMTPSVLQLVNRFSNWSLSEHENSNARGLNSNCSKWNSV